MTLVECLREYVRLNAQAGWVVADSALANEAADEIERLREAVSFLIDRIDELEWASGWEVFQREWYGHVEPALAHTRTALAQEYSK